MTEKVLIKYTTIPQSLYVNRKADEQLKNIVEEMQRPGYVLVARQMGKTNLLFNAKRTLESENRLFVYVDLSNVFTHECDCYRNIIDNILEPNEKLFESILSDIQSLRDKQLPPHKEYSKSLRIVLESFKGDVVIVLDEIDALISVDYSDNIFAQIRSNYFSRTNFPDFERLTYILSGVIEPSALIKDRNKSPFNIGEKIYLDDFTKEEHNTFIEKSSLNLTSEISEEIYGWANGNPRLTFDICSEIETFIASNNNIEVKDLHLIIKRKYLTSFDIAPIDHVRELVKSDKKVRVAILSVLKGQSNSLSDEIKRKLYLYGIINSSFDEETVIKNKVIKNSLSENWLRSVDKESRSQFTYALSLYEDGEFANAIEALLGYLEDPVPPLPEVEACNYYIGYSYYNLKEYEKSYGYFSHDFCEDEYDRSSKSFQGVCKLAMGDFEEGRTILEEVIKQKGHDFAYHNALLNLASNLDPSEADRAFDLYQELYQSTFESEKSREEEMNQLRALSSYYQTEIFINKGNIESAIEKINLAIEHSSLADGVFLKYLRNSIASSKDENIEQTIVDCIVGQNMRFVTGKTYLFSFTQEHLFTYLDLVFNPEYIELFEKLLDYSENVLCKGELNRFELAYLSSKKSEKSEDILNYILSFEKQVNNELLLKIYRGLCFKHSDGSPKYLSYFNKYKKSFHNNEGLIKDDIYLFSLAIKHNSNLNRFKNALELCSLIGDRINASKDEEIQFESLIIYYWNANLNFRLHNTVASILYANKTIELIKESKRDRTSLIDEEGLKAIQEQMEKIKGSSSVGTPVVNVKKYGRNEKVKVKYLNGEIIEGKYKKLMADILSGKCEVIQ